MIEVWKDVVGFEGIYKVSNKGNIKSLDREVISKGSKRIIKGRDIKPYNNGIGYIQVNLYKNSRTYKKYVHRVVLESFLGKSSLDVNHKDHNKSNNILYNLEFVTKKENINKMLIFYGTSKIERVCKCGVTISRYSKSCNKCLKIDTLINNLLSKPSLGSLLRDVYSLGYEATGRKYEVSGNAIKKWIKNWHKIMEKED